MSLPYQCVIALGQSGIVASARGTTIFTFSPEGALLSSWEHPATQHKAAAAGDSQANADQAEEEHEEGSSPTKRRKVETNSGVEAVAAGPGDATEQGQAEAKGDDQKKTKKGRHLNKLSPADQPHVNFLRTTSSGSHLVAVTGADKAVWVFEHDGKGQLTALGQRCMPKRPCDLAVTSDDNAVLVADKFGDVYSMPLVPGSEPIEAAETPKAYQPTPSKGADNLTVHTQRNLKALIDQERQRQNNPQPKTKEAPKFAHELLIGHVSMLTSVAVASSADGKPYILTADRDEHIRVSRGIPQAYVIENFCLGHKAFVNALCLPRSDVLVSGGGDDELYVWDWQNGTLKSKTDLLSHVKQRVPEATKIAVSRLVSSEDGWVVATCERVAAVFIFRFADDKLSFVQTLEVPGNALDVAIIPSGESSEKRLAVGLDADEAATPRLAVFQLGGEHWEPSGLAYQDTDVSAIDFTRAELDNVLYAVENLRKTENPWGDDDAADTPAADSEGPSSAAN
ncbi:tRNA (guanine-N(7)-)-methyltransferase non-catalytic subunit trm82 [Pestalotiopsis sp. 9143b]|nr:tRNA (guanine-N(7)-)-methyltransferase non-catalytic subunit trm82 [Pestalotiopsis sp. 9143b]